MDQPTRERRSEISRRLKAARWLAGDIDDKGRPAPLSPEALAEREPLRRNNISANAISEIERMVKDARPMELREIAEALELPYEWFTGDRPAEARTEALQNAAAMLGPLLLGAAQATRQEQEQAQRDTDEPDHPAGAAEGDDG